VTGTRAHVTSHPRWGIPRVVVADDHPLLRLALADDLAAAGFDVCAQAATAPEAVATAVREQPDLCILDINMPGGGLDGAAEIRRCVPTARVVMFTVSESEEDFLAAVRAGASGYLLKSMDPARVPYALWDVLAGIPAFPRRFVPSLVVAARQSLGAVAATPA
jgi:DNA-binding NarL/FixJ family response regulator